MNHEHEPHTHGRAHDSPGHPHDAAHDDSPACNMPHARDARVSELAHELREHMPFSVSAVAIGLIVAGTICILGNHLSPVGAGGQAGLAGGRTGTEARPTDPAAISQGDGHVHDDADPTGADHAGHDHRADLGGQDPVAPDRRANDHAPTDLGAHDHGEGDEHAHAFDELFFHLFHPAHMLFSAAATTAMFRRYDRRLIKACVVGLLGAVVVCGISDIAIPHVSAMVLGANPPLHLCIVQHPTLVFPFAMVGVALGLAAAGGVMKSTLISHSLHVFASTMASIFYMVGSLGMVAWIDRLGMVFLFVVIAVMLPCCLSDIVYPLWMSKGGREAYRVEPHHH